MGNPRTKPWPWLVVAGASLLGGCDESPQLMEQWLDAPGTMGFINLEEVQKSFQEAEEVGAFETRVNQVFEGDGLVRLQRQEKDGGYLLQGCEDLNWDNAPGCQGDDLLFSLLVAGGTATLVGEGVNRYYRSTFDYPIAGRDPMRFPLPGGREEEERGLVAGSSGHYGHYGHYGHHGYYTRWPSYDEPLRERAAYRTSPGFQSQVNRNADFEQRMSRQHGAAFANSINALSPQRRTDITTKSRSSMFAQRLTQGRSATGWNTRQVMAAANPARSSRLASSFSRSPTRSSFSSGGGSGFRVASGFGPCA